MFVGMCPGLDEGEPQPRSCFRCQSRFGHENTSPDHSIQPVSRQRPHSRRTEAEPVISSLPVSSGSARALATKAGEKSGLKRQLPCCKPVVFSAEKAEIVDCMLPSPAEWQDMIDLQVNGRPASDTVLADVCTASMVALEHGVSYSRRDMPGAFIRSSIRGSGSPGEFPLLESPFRVRPPRRLSFLPPGFFTFGVMPLEQFVESFLQNRFQTGAPGTDCLCAS